MAGSEETDSLLGVGRVSVLGVGAGKSSLLRLFINALSNSRYRPIYVHLTHLNAPSLLRLIVTELDEKPRLGKDRLFRQILQRVHKADAATDLRFGEKVLRTPTRPLPGRSFLENHCEVLEFFSFAIASQVAPDRAS